MTDACVGVRAVLYPAVERDEADFRSFLLPKNIGTSNPFDWTPCERPGAA
jgi:hypothetical protein